MKNLRPLTHALALLGNMGAKVKEKFGYERLRRRVQHVIRNDARALKNARMSGIGKRECGRRVKQMKKASCKA